MADYDVGDAVFVRNDFGADLRGVVERVWDGPHGPLYDVEDDDEDVLVGLVAERLYRREVSL